jgi:hypothetical protein
MFRRSMSPPSSGPKNKLLLATFFILVSWMAYSSAVKMEATCFSKCRLTFNGLHGVRSQKIGLLSWLSFLVMLSVPSNKRWDSATITQSFHAIPPSQRKKYSVNQEQIIDLRININLHRCLFFPFGISGQNYWIRDDPLDCKFHSSNAVSEWEKLSTVNFRNLQPLSPPRTAGLWLAARLRLIVVDMQVGKIAAFITSLLWLLSIPVTRTFCFPYQSISSIRFNNEE